MEESLVCECGNTKFWYFWDRVRCSKCSIEYKMTEKIISQSDYNEIKIEEKWVRKFDHDTHQYGHWKQFE